MAHLKHWQGVGLLGFVLIVGLVGACSSAGAGAGAGGPRIDVIDVRAPAPASPDIGVVYFSVRNRGGAADRLVSASTDVAGMAMVHQEVRRGLLVSMEPTGPITVPAHHTVVLSAGGSHLMLSGLDRTLKVGDHFTLTLHFQQSGDLPVSVPVVPYGSS
jgi:copper(I)-binding protein